MAKESNKLCTHCNELHEKNEEEWHLMLLMVPSSLVAHTGEQEIPV